MGSMDSRRGRLGKHIRLYLAMLCLYLNCIGVVFHNSRNCVINTSHHRCPDDVSQMEVSSL